METYHKINALYKRHKDGKKKGKLIMSDWAVPEFEYLANNPWEFTEKVDGTNIRIGADHGGILFGGRTFSAVIPPVLLDALIFMFDWQSFRDTFSEADLREVTLFGEGYGPKIQSGGKYRSDASFVLYDVKIGDWWLDREDVNDIARKLGIDAVPVLGTGTLDNAIDIVKDGWYFDKDNRIVDFRGGSVRHGLKSAWGDFEAEGIVARPVVPLFNRKGERIITKIKAVDFK